MSADARFGFLDETVVVTVVLTYMCIVGDMDGPDASRWCRGLNARPVEGWMVCGRWTHNCGGARRGEQGGAGAQRERRWAVPGAGGPLFRLGAPRAVAPLVPALQMHGVLRTRRHLTAAGRRADLPQAISPMLLPRSREMCVPSETRRGTWHTDSDRCLVLWEHAAGMPAEFPCRLEISDPGARCYKIARNWFL